MQKVKCTTHQHCFASISKQQRKAYFWLVFIQLLVETPILAQHGTPAVKLN